MMPNGLQRTEIVIVDPNPADYAELARPAYESGLTLRSLASGREALRAAARLQPDLWVINVRLPDMSGFDLVEMLRSKSPDAHFFCVSDAYCAEEEIHSHLVKAAVYLCKPVQSEWITAWVSQARRRATYASSPGQGDNERKT
jgi:DNA-binding response OmpR family regulator